MTTTPFQGAPPALAGLREIARALSGASDLDTTLDLIAHKTTEVMGVDSCSIYLIEEDGAMWLSASTGLNVAAVGRGFLRMGEGLTGWAAQHGAPVAVTDAQADPRFKWVPYTEEVNFASLLAVPLTSQERVIGAMNVQTVKPHAFTTDESALLALIADLAAGVLERARLIDSQARQLRELKTLARVSQTINEPLYLDEMLNVVVEMAAKVMGAAVCTLRLVDDEQEELVVRAAKSNIDYKRKPPIKTTEGINGLVVRERRPITVADVRADKRFPFREAAAREGLVSMLAVPLIVRERVIGVMNAFTTEPRTFTDAEIGLFSTLANQTALAIENAQLVTNAAVVREMHHRVRNNLQQVAMLLRLQAGQGGDPGGHLATAVNRVQSIAAVHDALAHEGYRLVNVKDVAERLARLGAQSLIAPGLKLALTVDGEPISLPSRSATSLALVINELLANALEHAFRGREAGRVNVHFSHHGDSLIIDVVDDGIGLPPGFQANSSLGLEIVYALVHDDLRGTLDFSPNVPSGTRATLRLPRPDLYPSD